VAVNRIGQSGIAQSIDHDKQRSEKNEEMPIDQVEHLMRVAPGEHHHQRRAGHCRPSQIQAGEEANKDRHEHNTDEGEQTAIQFCSRWAARSIVASRNVFRNPNRKMQKLIASLTIAEGRSARENSGNEMREKCPMIMFCGLPTSVATLPMFALVARAMRYGNSGKFPRRITATTSCVSIR
jgi:hypothetical protein